MNKRIAELAALSVDTDTVHSHGAFGEPERYTVKTFNPERFTQLLIKDIEAIRIELSQFDRSSAYGDGYESGLSDMLNTIQETFEVV